MTKYKGVGTLEVLEGADNYNEWIASRLSPHINSPALEIGAGTGNITELFKHIDDLTVTDVDKILVKKLNNRFKSFANIRVEMLDIAAKFGKVSSSFASIYSVNVLEHIEDDSLALSNMNRLLKKNGKLVILVPAKRFAHTTLDVNLGHFRRYEKDELAEKLRLAKFKIEYMEFFNIVGLASWILRNFLSRNHYGLKKSQVKMFDAIVPFLKILEPKQGLPLGISLIVVATKTK